MTKDMDDILVAAQQAYAYLHGFHTRLADTVSQLVSEIGKGLDQDFTFVKASKINNGHTSFRQNPYDRNARWVWDWLPLYEFTALLTDETSNRHGTLVIEMRFEMDRRWQGEDDRAPTLDAAKAGHSALTAYIWHHAEGGRDWQQAWEESDWPDEDGQVIPAHGGFELVRFDVDLNNLVSEDAIRDAARALVADIAKVLGLSVDGRTA